MKIIKFIILIIITSIVGACSSDSSDDNQIPESAYYISFNVNNQEVVYSEVLSASRNYNATLGIYGVSILGAEANTALAIYIYDTEAISTNSFTGDLIPNKFIIGAMISYSTGAIGFTSAATNISTVAHATITITEITDMDIAGNFNGVLVANSDYNTATHTITGGKFRLKFLNP